LRNVESFENFQNFEIVENCKFLIILWRECRTNTKTV
jgi:hypothetical protein